ncbi:MAG: orotidine 5'-phosphate decarboxylase / HUMPS family protein [Patescibacteria group bacterium]
MGGDRSFRPLLTDRQIATNTLLCVGLDPLVEKCPSVVLSVCRTDADAVFLWMQEIVNATAPFASMFKPQFAHWLAIPGGFVALRALIAHIRVKYPEIPVLVDCKCGDIDRTQRQYREAHFTLMGADGMNYNGYMGRDTLASLIDPKQPGRALVGLGRTSNPAAWEIQDAVMADGRHFWEFMVERLLVWSQERGVV